MQARQAPALVAAIAAALASPLLHADDTFRGIPASTSAYWSNPSAWSNNAPPGSFENAYIPATLAGNTAILDYQTQVNALSVGSTGSGSAQLTLNGGSLSANSITNAALGTVDGFGSLKGALDNVGTLLVDQAGTTLQLNFTAPSTNSGNISISGTAHLVLTADAPTVAFDNTGGAITVADGTPSFYSDLRISNLAINGGTITAGQFASVYIDNTSSISNASLSGTVYSGSLTLSNATLNGTFVNGGDLILAGTLVNNANLTNNQFSYAVQASGAVTLKGSGIVDAAHLSGDADSSLTVGSSQTVQQSSISVPLLTNNGVISFAGPNGYSYLSITSPYAGYGALTNAGTIAASNNAVLAISIPQNAAFTNSGNITASGGASISVAIGSFVTLDNTNGMISATTDQGSLSNSTISLGSPSSNFTLIGGQLLTDAQSQIHIAGPATLSNLQSNGNLYIDAETTLSNVTLGGNLLQRYSTHLSGNITNNANWISSGLVLNTSLTISGNGSIALDDASISFNQFSTPTLTIGASQTLDGAGQIYVGIVNNGSLLANPTPYADPGMANSGSLGIGPLADGTASIRNAGTLGAVNGGTFTFTAAAPSTLDNADGTISADAATYVGGPFGQVRFSNTSVSGGRLLTDSASRIFFVGGSLTNATASGNLVFSGTTILSNDFFTGTLTVNAGTATFHSQAILSALTLTAATLDTTTSSLIIQPASAKKSPTLALLRGYLATGALTSSSLLPNTALALLDNANLGLTSFEDQQVDPNSLILTPLLLGDANADNTVNNDDLQILLNHFGQPAADWTAGNFTGDPTIDLTDLSYVLNNMNLTYDPATGTISSASAPVPEPASVALLLIPALVLLQKRRRFRPSPR